MRRYVSRVSLGGETFRPTSIFLGISWCGADIVLDMTFQTGSDVAHDIYDTSLLQYENEVLALAIQIPERGNNTKN